MPAPRKRTTSKRTSGKKQDARRAITPEDLLRLEPVSDPRISPDGRRVLFTKKHVGSKNESVTNLWIVETDGGPASTGGRPPRQFTSGGKDSHGRFSPDGTRIAFIAEREGTSASGPQIHLMPADGGEAVRLTGFPEGTIGSFAFSPDGTQLAVAFRPTEPEWTAEAKKQREETGGSIPPRVIDTLYYRLDGDGYFGAQRFALYVVDVSSGEHRLLFDKDQTGSLSYDWAPDSSELVVSANTATDGLLEPWKVDLFRVDANRYSPAGGTGRAKKIRGLPLGEKAAVRWSPDGRWIAYAGTEGKEIWGVRNTRLFLCTPDGSERRDLTGGEDYCLAAATLSDTAEPAFGATVVWSPDSERIYLNIGWHGELHVASIGIGRTEGVSPSATAAETAAVRGEKVAFHTQGRRCLTLGNVSDDGRRIALAVSDAVHPPEIAVGERQGKGRVPRFDVTTLTEFHGPLLEELRLSEPQPFEVESASGTPVPLWMMLPPDDRSGKKYPAVLEIHGGPHAQYGENFFHEFQTLAAAGYVVVFANPRGSKGYGEEHCIAIRGTWGTGDWEDVQAVIDFMQERPEIDTRKMGVMGGSYGGYMTNWAIGHTDVFAAAITDRCVANLVSMVGSSDLPLVPNHYWKGNSWDDTEELWAQSPLRWFGEVNTPTLVIHSEGDLRCNVEQGEQVFAALKLRGVPTRFVRYPSTTSHGLSRSGPPDLRLHRLGQILDWWKRYLAK